MEASQYENILSEFGKVNTRLDQAASERQVLKNDVASLKTTVTGLESAAAEVREIKVALLGNAYNPEGFKHRLEKVEIKASKNNATIQRYRYLGTGIIIGLTAIANWLISIFKAH